MGCAVRIRVKDNMEIKQKLDVNGYNSVFKSFVNFARERVDANEAKAVADAHVNKRNGRNILAVTRSETDEVHKWLRTTDECAVNDKPRSNFKLAIIDMFGGESNIPASVKEAMLLSDYNAGKPIPPAPYVSSGQLEITQFETVQGGLAVLEGDLYRPENYSLGVNAPGLLGADGGFGFIFPGESRFVTNGSEAGRARQAEQVRRERSQHLCADTDRRQPRHLHDQRRDDRPHARRSDDNGRPSLADVRLKFQNLIGQVRRRRKAIGLCARLSLARDRVSRLGAENGVLRVWHGFR